MSYYSIIQVGKPLRLECTNAGIITYKDDESLDDIFIDLSRAIQRGDWGKNYVMQEKDFENHIRNKLNNKEKLNKYIDRYKTLTHLPSYWFLSPCGSLLGCDELIKFCKKRYL